MQFKLIAAALLSASAVLAAPQNTEQPDLGDIITSAVAEGATSIFGEATSAIVDAGTAAGSGIVSLASGAESLATRATSAIGEQVTKASSAIGEQISDAVNDDGAAVSFKPQQALFVGAATVVGSAFVGAFFTL